MTNPNPNIEWLEEALAACKCPNNYHKEEVVAAILSHIEAEKREAVEACDRKWVESLKAISPATEVIEAKYKELSNKEVK